MSQKLSNVRKLSLSERELLLSYFEKRFAICPSYFNSLVFFRSNDVIWGITQFSLEKFEGLDKEMVFERLGMRICRGNLKGPKPTSTFLQTMNHEISQNRISIERDQLLKYFKREPIKLIEHKAFMEKITDGYVAVEYNARIVGCGRLDKMTLSSEFPKKLVHNIKLSQL